MKIKIIMCPADREPYVTWISDTLENMQKIVGGYIETVTAATDAVVVCNEEGRLIGLPENKSLPFGRFCGDCFICGVSGDAFVSLENTAFWLRKAEERWEQRHEG